MTISQIAMTVPILPMLEMPQPAERGAIMCSGIRPGGEPANATSNLAFLAASALLLWLLAGQCRHTPTSVWLLPYLAWHCLNAVVLL